MLNKKEDTIKQNSYLVLLKDLVLKELKDQPVKIVVFGSRARGDQNVTSDVDIAIIPTNNFDKDKLTLLREKVEQLNIPYEVDIVNLKEAGETFRKEILKDAIVWKD